MSIKTMRNHLTLHITHHIDKKPPINIGRDMGNKDLISYW